MDRPIQKPVRHSHTWALIDIDIDLGTGLFRSVGLRLPCFLRFDFQRTRRAAIPFFVFLPNSAKPSLEVGAQRWRKNFAQNLTA
jgi:hypothetical protein